MEFNCPMYECDGHDCEVCGRNPGNVPPHWTAPVSLLRPDVLGFESNGRFSAPGRSSAQWWSPAAGVTSEVGSPRTPAPPRRELRDPRCNDFALFVHGQPLTCRGLLYGRRISARTRATCEGTFCDGCGAAAGACDRTCGFCATGDAVVPFPASGSGLDDEGHVGEGSECSAEGAREGGPDHGGADLADDNAAGFTLAAHGDEEAPRRQRPSWVIMLTMAISPLQGVTHTQRLAPFLRERDYARALRRWSGGGGAQGVMGAKCGGAVVDLAAHAATSASLWPIVVVESSGANLTALRRAVAIGRTESELMLEAGSRPGGREAQSAMRKRRAPHWHARPVEFVSFQLGLTGGEADVRRGKGVAEFKSIQHALAHSEIIRQHRPTHIAKVTGRYFARGLDEELNRITSECTPGAPPNEQEGQRTGGAPACPVLAVQSTPSPWTLWDGVLRSEVIGWELGREQWLFGGQDESLGRPMERVLFERAVQLNSTEPGAVAYFNAMAVGSVRNAEGACVRVL
jgi:hypothetical protein